MEVWAVHLESLDGYNYLIITRKINHHGNGYNHHLLVIYGYISYIMLYPPHIYIYYIYIGHPPVIKSGQPGIESNGGRTDVLNLGLSGFMDRSDYLPIYDIYGYLWQISLTCHG